MPEKLVSVRSLTKTFVIKGGKRFSKRSKIHALNNVDLDIEDGESVGLVGESGCGKSTLGRCLVGLLRPSSGTVYFAGRPISDMSQRQRRLWRKEAQMVFQDSHESLDPRVRVIDAVVEGLRAQRIGSRGSRLATARQMLERVGIPAELAEVYPGEMSGGQRQRVVIGRALVLNPRFIVADEPVSALDVSIRAQVLNLLSDLRHEFQCTMVMISHDIDVISFFASRIVVLYLGVVVEMAPAEALVERPLHPYSGLLLLSSGISAMDSELWDRSDPGETGGAINVPEGCVFSPRCPFRQEVCFRQRPPLREVSPGRWVACHFPMAHA